MGKVHGGGGVGTRGFADGVRRGARWMVELEQRRVQTQKWSE